MKEIKGHKTLMKVAHGAKRVGVDSARELERGGYIFKQHGSKAGWVLSEKGLKYLTRWNLWKIKEFKGAEESAKVKEQKIREEDII